MIPEFPIVREAIKKEWNKRLFKALGFSDPLVSQIPLRVQKEGNKVTIGAKEIEFRPISTEHQWKTKVGRGIPFDDYFALADKMGSDLARQQALGTFKMLSETTGPRHMFLEKPKGEHLSFDDLMSKLDGMEIDFDPMGLPNWPPVWLGEPALAHLYQDFKTHEFDEDRRKRIDELVARKRKEFNERETRRRLVD